MTKAKLTLTVDKETIRYAKSRFALEGTSISQVVEDLLKSYTGSWIDKMMEELGVRERHVGYADVVMGRSRGLDAGKLVREMRDARANSVSRY